MASSRSPNHPALAHHFVQVSEPSTATLAPGQQYGLFSALVFFSFNSGAPTNYKVIVMANTSAAYALESGWVYSLLGKLIVPNANSPPIFSYFPETMICCCKVKAFVGDTTNKTSVDAFGTATAIDCQVGYNNGAVENSLMVTMRHHDWDPQLQSVRAFSIKYRIPGRCNMANTHVLFQVNREFYLVGFLCDWDLENNIPVIEVLALSWINPPNALRGGQILPGSGGQTSSQTQTLPLRPLEATALS
ncbi:hypothetical protein PCANC_14578 [Puccinia coronata f. sp. avenae]|uniref:Uncharacterized protein n=1 Tax=Puccinia coronata f. sp. avenae TaxID=200324 RepID=A0A2N5UG84_9BASI|nr:hypothetical protein PCANC_14578 [Puccinia coronata f. sp. avenae]